MALALLMVLGPALGEETPGADLASVVLAIEACANTASRWVHVTSDRVYLSIHALQSNR